MAPLLCNPDDPGTLRHSDEEKADILQSQFCSMFTHEPEGEIPQLEPRIGERLEKLVITQEWVLKALMKTNITKSCGPDELHPRMLKEFAVQLAAPMTKLFNQSLFLGEVPEEWKMANLSPIFKKGSRKVAANYRPVSLTSISCKIMEAAVQRDNPHAFEKEQPVIDKTVRLSWRTVNHSATTNILRQVCGCDI